FPFEGALAAGKHRFAYTKQDVSQILSLARDNQLEVIPLIQTFGHLEYFLKLPEFRSLREDDQHPQAICPSRDEPFELVKKIIDQVVEAHRPHIKSLHIGCDEVFQLGHCDKCRNKDRDELFASYGEFE